MIYLVLPLSLLLVLAAVVAFMWAVRSGQLDDLETPGARILSDDDDLARPGPPPEPADRDTDTP